MRTSVKTSWGWNRVLEKGGGWVGGGGGKEEEGREGRDEDKALLWGGYD